MTVVLRENMRGNARNSLSTCTRAPLSLSRCGRGGQGGGATEAAGGCFGETRPEGTMRPPISLRASEGLFKHTVG